jgi:hypothetical protein
MNSTAKMMRNRIAATGRSMKSSGVLMRAIEARSLTSMMPPKTIPKIIGTTGNERRFSTNPITPKTAAIMQSVTEFRKA